MRILFINTGIHHKNKEAFYGYNFDLTEITDINNLKNVNIQEYDAVYSPSTLVDTTAYPDTIFLFGPHFFVFPDERIQRMKQKNNVYIQSSDWTVSTIKMFPISRDVVIKSIPFAVNTQKFKSDIKNSDRENVFVYFKHRNPNELKFVETFLKDKNINYKVISYDKKYNENDYLEYIKNSKYGIWVGCHESQGFALQEALSCNVPLLVWNVKSMSQEYNMNYPNIYATTIPYWDSNCGMMFFEENQFQDSYDIFLKNLSTFSPRKYIMDNLSTDKCKQRFIDVIKEMKSLNTNKN